MIDKSIKLGFTTVAFEIADWAWAPNSEHMSLSSGRFATSNDNLGGSSTWTCATMHHVMLCWYVLINVQNTFLQFRTSIHITHHYTEIIYTLYDIAFWGIDAFIFALPEKLIGIQELAPKQSVSNTSTHQVSFVWSWSFMISWSGSILIIRF